MHIFVNKIISIINANNLLLNNNNNKIITYNI